jgi:hypothetical protein
MWIKEQNDNFFKWLKQFGLNFSHLQRDHLPILNCKGGIFRKIMVHALEAQTQNNDFVETGFTGQPNFTIQYSVTNNGLLRNNPFCFQSSTVKVNNI